MAKDLQFDFSLHQALSLFALSALEELDAASPTYAVDVLSVVESILEDPDVILRRQMDRAKGRLVAQLKEEGVPYEERMERLEEVTHPKPLADFLYGAFNAFRTAHPWTAGSDVSPKSIGREMFETFAGFSDYVKSYGLERSEGVLLRYLSQLYRTLDQTVPGAREDRRGLGRARASSGRSWGRPTPACSRNGSGCAIRSFSSRKRRRPPRRRGRPRRRGSPSSSRTRASSRRASARRRSSSSGRSRGRTGRRPPNACYADAGDLWDAARFEAALAPFFEEYGELLSGAEARLHHLTKLTSAGPRRWEVAQTLLDPKGDNTWAVFAEIDLTDAGAPDGPDSANPAHRNLKRAILRQVVPVSTPFLLGLVLVLGALGIWYFRARSARDSQPRLRGEQGPQHGRPQRPERRSRASRSPLGPALRPGRHRVDRGGEVPALLREAYSTRTGVAGTTVRSTILLLQLLQPLAQHPVRDVGDGVAQRREMAAGAEQQVDDGARPAASDQFDRPVIPAAEGEVGGAGALSSSSRGGG